MNAAPTTPLRALIVDDEPPARRKVRLFLERDPQIEIVGEADSGEKAVDAIVKLSPDVVFLDIQMGEMDGFDVLRALDDATLPQIVRESRALEAAVEENGVEPVTLSVRLPSAGGGTCTGASASGQRCSRTFSNSAARCGLASSGTPETRSPALSPARRYARMAAAWTFGA